ncbi:MAG TPA: hypothetical protein PKA27_00805, partial [Fimbriimonadaceae bacterium]|nr:hypothetical protein [Fimbriimonadaceae bacterium]
MIRSRLQAIVADAVASLIESGKLPAGDYPAIEIVDTKQPEHGDYACNFALTASKVAGKNPRELGEMLSGELGSWGVRNLDSPLAPSAGRGAGGEGQSGELGIWGIGNLGSDPQPTPQLPKSPNPFSSIEVAGPGFINLRLNPAWIASFVPEILAKGESLSQVPNSPTSQAPSRINLEFVSVNPNGPITIGSGRGAAYGSTLGNVLEAAGHTVHREYYINDGVNSEQMRLFAESVRAAGTGQAVPENGYKGDYVARAAETLKSHWLPNARGNARNAEHDSRPGAHGRAKIWHAVADLYESTKNPEQVLRDMSVAEIQHLAGTAMTGNQEGDLLEFGVEYDTWFSEQSLHDAGKVEECIQHLIENGAADEEPYRTKLKLGKGGKIEEVIREAQITDDDSDSPEEPLTPNPL